MHYLQSVYCTLQDILLFLKIHFQAINKNSLRHHLVSSRNSVICLQLRIMTAAACSPGLQWLLCHGITRMLSLFVAADILELSLRKKMSAWNLWWVKQILTPKNLAPKIVRETVIETSHRNNPFLTKDRNLKRRKDNLPQEQQNWENMLLSQSLSLLLTSL